MSVLNLAGSGVAGGVAPRSSPRPVSGRAEGDGGDRVGAGDRRRMPPVVVWVRHPGDLNVANARICFRDRGLKRLQRAFSAQRLWHVEACGSWWWTTTGRSPARSSAAWRPRASPSTSPSTARRGSGRPENAYDAIVLDVMLPGMSGYASAPSCATAGNWAPILMLTAPGGELDEAGRWTPGPTTSWPSRSRTSCWSPGCAPCCARGGGTAGRAGRGDLRLDPATHQVSRGDAADRS